MQNASLDIASLNNPTVIESIVHILKINNSVATSLKSTFITQMSNIYFELLNIYRLYSEVVTQRY